MTKPTNPFLRGAQRPVPCMPIGHRGARGLAPENTLVSFQRGVELGARMVELDVHLSRDGVPVVFHDHKLTRCTDAKVRYPERAPWDLAAFDLAELRTLDAGSWFVYKPPLWNLATREEREHFLAPDSLRRFGGDQVRIPTLEEVLLYLDDKDGWVNVELKAIPFYEPFLATQTLALVRRLGLEHRVLFSSFDHQLIRELKRAEPRVAAGILSRDRLALPARYLVDIVGADAYHPGGRPEYDSLGLRHLHTFGSDIYSQRIEDLQAEGLGVYVWTIDDTRDIALLRDAGVDGIMSDFPNRLTAALGDAAP